MSTGGIVGGVTGAAIGFVYAGPYGAIVGAAIGFAGGMLADPIVVDVAKPDFADLSAPTAEEGLPIFDVLGTSKVAGNFLWYGNPRTEEVTDSSGGKNSSSYVSGYKYFLSFSIGLCLGPISRLHCIYWDDCVLWEPDSGGSLGILDTTNGKVSIWVPGRGEIEFYFGTDDQEANGSITASTGHALPWRGLCYAVFNDFLIGDFNRVGGLTFAIQKCPMKSFTLHHIAGVFNYNPVTAIYHMLVDLRGISESQIDVISFQDAAEQVATEGLGLGVSIYFAKNNSVLDYLESLLLHIRGIIHHTTDGKLGLTLLRNDIDEADMLEIGEADILEEIDLNRPDLSETNNQITANYSRISEP